MTPLQKQERNNRVQAAMTPLVGDPRFVEFIDLVRELQDEAVSFSVTDDCIKSDNSLYAALGEVRAYRDIIGIFENFSHQAEQNALDEHDKASQ